MVRQRKKKQRPRQPEEAGAAEAATIAWMLTMMTALVCELAAVAARWYVHVRPAAEMVAVLSGFLIFAATISGIVSLVFAAVALKVRRVAPPRGITVFAIVVGAAPLLTLLARLLRE